MNEAYVCKTYKPQTKERLEKNRAFSFLLCVLKITTKHGRNTTATTKNVK